MPSISTLLHSFLHKKPKSFNHIKQIHALFITTGLKSPITLAKLIEQSFTLSPHQTPKHAHLIVNHETDCKVFLLNTVIKCSLPTNSVLHFAKWVSFSPNFFDAHTFIFALGACARLSSQSALFEGEQIHCRAIKLGFMLDRVVSTTCIHFYACNNRICFARKVFDEMSVRCSATWNALITGYSSQKVDSYENSCEALVCFKDMLLVDDSDIRPNGRTMASVLSAVSQLGSLEVGSSVHGFVAKTIDTPENDVYIGTGLVDLYSKCGCLDVALKIFATMKKRNVHTWTAMVAGLAFHGKGKEAIQQLNEMKKFNVRPNVVTFTSMLSACCHAGLVEEGLHLFHNMEKEFGVAPQMKHYGCIVDLLGKAGHLKEAYDFILGMPVRPNPVLWRSLLGSCRLHGDVAMGEKVGTILIQLQPEIHLEGVKPPTNDFIALSNVYASAERWEDVTIIREEMRNKGLEMEPGRSAVN